MRKNKIGTRFICVIIACIMTILSLYSCSLKGETLMSLEKAEVSVNMYQFWLSRYKADYIKNYMDGVEKTDFWDQIYDIKTNETYDDVLSKSIIENAKTIVAALYMFDELKLELPDSAVEDVDVLMADLVNEVGEGSKNVLNSELAKYGVNYNILREIYLNEQKIVYLQIYLFGEDAENISAAAKDTYYKENYLHFKHIYFFSNAKPVYEKDNDGQEIYYLEGDHIAYDKENGEPEYVDGVVVKDAKGDIIYYKEDGKISYDTENGKRAYVYGEDGYITTEECTIAEISERKQLSEELLERIENGENFESLMEEYNEDVAIDEYPNGFYYPKNSPYYYSDILTAVDEMEIGEVKIVNSAYGIHIIKRYELEESGYTSTTNHDFFEDFNNSIMTEAFVNKAAEYYDKIEIDEELLKSYTLKDVKPCYNY